MPAGCSSWFVGSAMALFVVTLGAQGLHGLPPDGLVLPASADSPGRVLFNHSMHVQAEAPDCTTCHPKPFRMLRARTPEDRITHERMENGGQCGRCHDGKTAFGLEEDCSFCHRGEEEDTGTR